MARFFLILMVFLGTPACHDDPPVTYPTAVKIDESKLPLGPGDKLSLTVFYGSHQIQAQYTLDASGDIAVQFIGTVSAAGKNIEELTEEIRAKLADGYLKDPIVSLNIVELNSLTLSVSGMVGRTGTLKFTPGMTITEAIAQAGGFTPMARKNMVKVVRFVNGTKQTYKLPVERMAEGERPNFPMMPGDEVFVPERPW